MKNALKLILLAVVCGAGISSAADTRGYLIERTIPRVGQRGTTVEVTIQGAFVKDPQEIMFYGPGIRAVEIQKIPDLQTRIGLAHGWFIKEQMRCKFEIAPDCPLGVHPFRVRTATELSNLGTFHVTPFPVVDENEKGQYENDTLDKAMPVASNVTVRGRLGGAARGDVDLYRVPAVAGQRLSVEVDAAQISDIHYGDSENDVMVRILDEAGKELGRNDDNPLHIQDPVLSVKLPRDGVAYVEVRRPIPVSSDTVYVAHIGNFRRPLVAFPAGGQAGHDEKIRFLGDALGEFEETVKVPETAGNFGYFGDAPSAVPLRSSPYPNVFESSNGLPQLVKFPAALNGIITGPEEVDRFRFTAKKGERLQFRTFATTIGSTIDAKLVVRAIGADGKPGAVAIEADDAKLADHDIFGTAFRSGGGMREILDPSFVWDCGADGDYILEVSDSSGTGGPLGVYRIEVAAPKDSLYVYIPCGEIENARISTLAVHQGGTMTATFNLASGQGNQFKGEFELIAHGLPKGVRMVASRVPAGAANWPVQFVADATPQPGCAAITFEAKPTDATKTVETFSQQNVQFISHPGGDGWRVVRLNHFILAVVDPRPFSITLTPPAIPLVRGGEVAIPVKVTRKPGFNGTVSFTANWLSQGVASGVPVVVPPGQTDAELRLTATPEARVGTWPLSAVVQDDLAEETSNNGFGFSVSSDVINLTVAAPFLELSSKLESIRRGERKKFVWSVKHSGPQPGPAQVKLLGLPNGMRVIEPLPMLTQDTQEISFEVEATDDALLGKTGELNCAVIFHVGNQEIVQRTGKGALRVDPKL